MRIWKQRQEGFGYARLRASLLWSEMVLRSLALPSAALGGGRRGWYGYLRADPLTADLEAASLATLGRRGCWEICSQGTSGTLSNGSAWCSALAASYLLWRCWSAAWTACGWAWECWRRPPSRCASLSGLCWGWRERRRSNRWTRLHR